MYIKQPSSPSLSSSSADQKNETKQQQNISNTHKQTKLPQQKQQVLMKQKDVKNNSNINRKGLQSNKEKQKVVIVDGVGVGVEDNQNKQKDKEKDIRKDKQNEQNEQKQQNNKITSSNIKVTNDKESNKHNNNNNDQKEDQQQQQDSQIVDADDDVDNQQQQYRKNIISKQPQMIIQSPLTASQHKPQEVELTEQNKIQLYLAELKQKYNKSIINDDDDGENRIANVVMDQKKQPQSQQQQQLLSSSSLSITDKIEILEFRKKYILSDKQTADFTRINHIEFIFKHYCTHVFKIGKYMTFQKLQYYKTHLTLDRLAIFLKDFGLTTMDVSGRQREILDKNQVIKIFKMVSSNCRELDFQQFIVCLQRLGQLYYDAKSTYYQRKEEQKQYRAKVKMIIQKKEKHKRQMLERHKGRLQELNQKSRVQTTSKIQEQEDDDINAHDEEAEDGDSKSTIDKNKDLQKSIQKASNNNTNSKHQQSLLQQKGQLNKQQKQQRRQRQNKQKQKQQSLLPFDGQQLLKLTKQQKIQYFYQKIGVDDVDSFRKKLKDLKFPYFHSNQPNQNDAIKKSLSGRQSQQPKASTNTSLRQEDQKQKQAVLKGVRDKLNKRSQVLKSSRMKAFSIQQYDVKKKQKKPPTFHKATDKEKSLQLPPKSHSSLGRTKKVNITESEINLSSLSKLTYENANFSAKFDPKSLYIRYDQDDDIFMKQYMDQSPLKHQKKLSVKQTGSKSTSSRVVFQKEINTQGFLGKLKNRQQQVEKVQKQNEISQMYRFNDRNQRQKRLIDKYLEKGSNNGYSSNNVK